MTVVDLGRAKNEAADLGTVISRVEGVNVQREGGLGSRARISLAGFDETQVRFFVDGVPLEYAGYSFGIQNVPVTFAERIEVYKGVVPVRLGADALGGAFELITDRSTRGTRATASYEGGSFDTHRLHAGVRHRDASSGLFVKAESFFDKTDNDYPIQVSIADRTGAIAETTVHRFHDGYRAGGGNVEVGLVDRPWAKRLVLRAFATDYRKEIQNNAIMTLPYGEAREGGLSSGASLRYEDTIGGDVSVRAVGGYVFDRGDFLDKSACTYNWFGQCANPRRVPGEIGTEASNVSVWDHSGFLRANVAWALRPDHRLRFATAPTYLARTGDNRLREVNDPTNDDRDMLKWVNGLEYEADFLASALQNVAFVKSYFQSARGDEYVGGMTVKRDARRSLWGAGDALRYDLLPWLFTKVSYEYATRLPDPGELFGNGRFFAENLQLEPERSHNANLSLAVDKLASSVGTLDASVTGFFREADKLIVLLTVDQILRYENVHDARVWGGEGALTWISPGEYVEVGGNATYQSLRNTSGGGRLGQFEGDRVPNRPYLWANGRMRLQKRAVMAASDRLSLTWYTRYVHEFYLNWASAGRKGSDTTVPSQLIHSLVLSYEVTRTDAQQLAFSSELQNLSDERAFDFFGVQRPGRAGYFKATITY